MTAKINSASSSTETRSALGRSAGSALSGAIRRAARLAREHREAVDAMAPLLIARYGCLPNDVDCDSFIDATDYGHGGMTLAELDAEMEARGYPPNDKTDPST